MSDQQVTALAILGVLAVFLFIFVLGLYGGIKYMGVFGDLTTNPPTEQKDN